MADVFVGQLLLVAFNYAPNGFALCQGQLLAISSNTALFSLLGTQFGGNGTSNFALPDLRGCVAVGQGTSSTGTNYQMGQKAGETQVQLLTTQTPSHIHTVSAAKATVSDSSTPSGNGLGPADIYSPSAANQKPLNANAITPFGNASNVPHNNLMPYVTLNWVIALQGIYPPRS